MSASDNAGRLKTALERSSPLEVMAVLRDFTDADRTASRKAMMPWIKENLDEWRAFLDPNTQWRRPEEYRRLQARLGHLFRTAKADRAALNCFRMAVVACGPRAEVERAIFSPRMQPPGWDPIERPQESFHYLAGLELLRRSEEWRREMLLRMVDHHPDDWWPGRPAAYQLGLHLWREQAFSESELLPPLSRQARRLGFHPEAGFEWNELTWRLIRISLEDREEPEMARVDYDGSLTTKIVEATQSGLLQRDEIIALALRRLTESSRPFDANWWGRFVEALECTPAEWAEHSAGVLDLIGAPNPRAVAVGLAAAARLLRTRAIQADELVPVLSLAVHSPVAGSAKAAVSLLRRCAELDETVRLEAFTTALNGLQHPKPAVHDAVLQWLEADTGWKEDPEALYAVADAGVMAPAAAAARLEALMPAEHAPPECHEPQVPAPGTEDLRLELDRRIAAAPTPERRGWLEKLRSTLDGGPLPRWSPPLHLRWRTGPAFSVPATAEETAQILLRVTVSRLTPPDWERIAVGVRLPMSDAERQMLPRLLDPVLRLRTALEDENPSARLADWGGAYGALRVAEAWAGVPSAGAPADSYWSNPHLSQGRLAQLRSILSAIKRGDGHVPLGTPTHESGWLDPIVFAERLAARRELPEEELWELSAALYRMAPDPELRAEEAWRRLSSLAIRWGHVPSLMVAAALAPGEEGERAQVALVNWLRGQPHEKLGQLREQAEAAFDKVQSLFGLKKQKRVEERSVNYHSLRLVTSALGCRHGTSPAPVLGLVRDRLPAAYGRLLDPRQREPSARQPSWMLDPSWSEWGSLADLFPETAALSPSPWQLSPAYAFYFPPVGFEIAEMILAQDEFQSWGVMPSMAVELLRLPYCPVSPCLRRLTRCLSMKPEQSASIVELWSVALQDGRVRLTELVENLVPALSNKDQKPRSILSALELLARQYPPARDVAVSACERVLTGSLDGITPNDRVRLLELLLEWHSEAGTAPAPAARAALEGVAAKGKNNRAGTLARQLLQLPRRSPRDAEEACRAHDVRMMLAGLPA